MAESVTSVDFTPEVGICYSTKNALPTCEGDTIVLGNMLRKYDFTIAALAGTTYYLRTYVKFLDKVGYSAVDTVTTMSINNKVINCHQFIDLGLPSGLLWADCNVGASSPEGYGEYFAWGETAPKSFYYSYYDSYKWGSPNYINSKYHGNREILELEDRAATVNWCADCRMLTYDDFQELKSECEWTQQTYYNGISGYIVTGPNGNSIFIPDDYVYWTSKRSSWVKAYTFDCYSIFITRYRDEGLSVRAVAEKQSC